MKTTIIIGPPNSGKTRKAEELTKDKKAIWIHSNDLSHCFALSEVQKDTEVIVLEDMRHVVQLKQILMCKTLMVNRQYEPPFTIEKPDLIITSSCLNESDFPNITFINL